MDTLNNFDQSANVFDTIADLELSNEPIEALEAFLERSKQAYWQDKDLAQVLAFSIAGLSYGFQASRTSSIVDAGQVARVLSLSKAIAYNLASFTWPGWNEPGITIGSSELRIGLDAAKTNLKLAVELEKGHTPFSRAHWMLGAQFLAAGQYADAEDSFNAAACFAAQAERRDEELLAQGFGCLARSYYSPQDLSIQEHLCSIKRELTELENGIFFVGQIDTAQKVFQDATSSNG